MAARRPDDAFSCSSSIRSGLFPFPRLAGVTKARCLLLGANTPWNRVRFTLGLGTKAANRARTHTDVLMARAQGCAGAPKVQRLEDFVHGCAARHSCFPAHHGVTQQSIHRVVIHVIQGEIAVLSIPFQ